VVGRDSVPSVVADTHALVWHLVEPRRLGKGAQRAFAACDAGRWLCHVPVVSLVETWLLHERGRLRIGPAQILEAIAGHPGYAALPLDVEQAIVFGALPSIRDPMDRLIVAAARVTGGRLISSDDVLQNHVRDVIWH
jgi:PIN domain nuclease of toxin-antitoxin system